MSSNKFEQLLDYIINEEQDKARDLFHEIVVDKSREIYEGLIDEQDLEAIEEEIDEVVDEAMPVSNNEVDDFVNDIKSDEEGLSLEDAEEDLEDEMDVEGGDEDDGGDVTPEENEERIANLEGELDALQAAFDALMAEIGGGEEGGEEEVEGEPEGAPEFESAESDEEPIEEESEEEETKVVREYTEKAPKPVGDKSDGKAMSHNRGAMKPSAANAGNLNQGDTGTDGAAPKVDSGGMDTKAPLENEV